MFRISQQLGSLEKKTLKDDVKF